MGQILIIEDSEHIKILIVTIVQDLGHDVFEATEIDEGLRYAKNNKIDLVITDLSVPGGKDGTDFLKEYVGTPDAAPVVVCTTVQEEKIKKEILSLGAIDFIPKPIDVPMFEKFINDFFASK